MESENSYGAPDILDMLFDDCGILKTEMKLDSIPFEDDKKMINYSNYDESDISNVNFGDFDLTENLFESLLNQAEPNSFFEEEPPKKCNSFHTDHTYIAQKSPSEHSDSGISVVSDDSPKNMTDDQLAKIQYQTHQPCDSAMDISPLPSDSHIFDLIGFDNGENEVNDSSYYSPNHDGQVSTDYLDDFDSSPGMNDEEFSIDFDTEEFDANLHDKGTQSILLIDGITKKIIPLKKNSKDSLPFTMRDVDPHVTNSTDFPKLRLTDEEKDLLNREGVTLPSHLPLTREEERVLKSVRRKIRNKVSAKESRKRKQTYVDGLEQRVKLCTAENRELQKKVCSLEKQNFTLISQLKRVQSLVGKSKLSANASTCVMVLLLSFALFVIPTFDPFGSSSNENHSPVSMSSQSVRGKARSLLEENTIELPGSDEDPYGVTNRPAAPWAKTVKPMSASPKMTEASIEDMEESEVKLSPADDNSQNAIPSREDVRKDSGDLNFVSEEVLPTENITLDRFPSSNDVHNVNQNVEV